MAIKGTIKKSLPTWEAVLKHTNGGYSVFINEIPGFSLGKSFCSPIRRDRNPSCSIVHKGGIWFMRDFSTGENFTALQLVQKKYGLSFLDAVNKMAQEYGLMEMLNQSYSMQPLQSPPEYEENEIQISFIDRKWRKEHYQFWDGTEVGDGHCRRYNTFAVKDLAINRRRVNIGEREVVWAYYAEDIQKAKIYFPERPRKEGERFKTNIKGQYLWNLSSTQECEKLIVHKSMKDLLVSSMIFPCNIATQNESQYIFDNELVEYLQKLSGNIYICYGSDDQGAKESIEITKKNKWKWVNTPKKYLPEINDIFSMAKIYGIESIQNLYKQKGII